MPEEIPRPWHRWAINEDPDARSAHETGRGRPDHCLVCGIVRYPLAKWAQEIAAGPCALRPLRTPAPREEE